MNIVSSSTNYSNIDNSRFQLEIPKIMSNNTSINPEKYYPVEHLLSTTSPYYQNGFATTPNPNSYMYSQQPDLNNSLFDDFLQLSCREKQHGHHHKEDGLINPPLSPVQYSNEPPHSPVSPLNQIQQLPQQNNSFIDSNLSAKPPMVQTSPTCSKSSRHFKCFNCNVTKTPLWRRTPDRSQTLCNACGLYFKQYKHHRPLHVQHKTTSPFPSNVTTQASSSSSSSSYTKSNRSSLSSTNESTCTHERVTPPPTVCTNCQQTQTPVWRKNKMGEPLCNACGLYVKLHNRSRPVEMRKSTIQRRRRDWSSPSNAEENKDLSFNTSTMTHMLLGSTDDNQATSLLQRMDKSQIEYFLNKLENKCQVLRSALDHLQELEMNDP
jgi:transcription elongation factor Elf1